MAAPVARGRSRRNLASTWRWRARVRTQSATVAFGTLASGWPPSVCGRRRSARASAPCERPRATGLGSLL